MENRFSFTVMFTISKHFLSRMCLSKTWTHALADTIFRMLQHPEEPPNHGNLEVSRPIDSATSLAAKLSACSCMVQSTQSWHNIKLCIPKHLPFIYDTMFHSNKLRWFLIHGWLLNNQPSPTTTKQIASQTYLKTVQQIHQEEMYKYLQMISCKGYQTFRILSYNLIVMKYVKTTWTILTR